MQHISRSKAARLQADTLKGTSKKLVMQVEKSLVKFVEAFKDKFKEIFNLDLEIKEIADEVKK